MVVDTSALAAILFSEDDAADFKLAIEDSEQTRISAATLLECTVVFLHRLGSSLMLDRVIAEAEIEIVPFTASQLMLARGAYERYGKGRHPASLNLGDCFSYALAKELGEPLLFKGNDFALTDVMRMR